MFILSLPIQWGSMSKFLICTTFILCFTRAGPQKVSGVNWVLNFCKNKIRWSNHFRTLPYVYNLDPIYLNYSLNSPPPPNRLTPKKTRSAQKTLTCLMVPFVCAKFRMAKINIAKRGILRVNSYSESTPVSVVSLIKRINVQNIN